jgi:hypothetical protein
LTEHAILGSAVEAQFIKYLLNGKHVVPAHGRLAQIQEPVAQTVPGFHEFGPRVVANDPIGKKEALLLKGFHGRFGVRSEESVRTLASEEVTEGTKTFLDIQNLFAPIAATDRSHEKHLQRECTVWRRTGTDVAPAAVL